VILDLANVEEFEGNTEEDERGAYPDSDVAKVPGRNKEKRADQYECVSKTHENSMQ
jgi:hypothetical protein